MLKSEFNLAWNYFNAKELSNTIFGYWREWLMRAESGRLNVEFPAPQATTYAHDVDSSRLTLRVTVPGHEDAWVHDLRKLDILDRKIIVSRKRTRNFFDLAASWKKLVLERLDEQVAEAAPEREATPFDKSLLVFKPPQLKPYQGVDSDDEAIVLHRGSPQAPDAWRFGTLR